MFFNQQQGWQISCRRIRKNTPVCVCGTLNKTGKKYCLDFGAIRFRGNFWERRISDRDCILRRTPHEFDLSPSFFCSQSSTATAATTAVSDI